MKLLLSGAFFITSCITAIAQQGTDSSKALYSTGDSTVRVTLHLMDQSSLAGRVSRIYDDSIIVYVENASKNFILKKVDIADIRWIKIKQHALLQGAAVGGMATGVVGFGCGYVTTKGNSTEDDYYANARARGWEWALISAVPGAVAGGIIGGIAIKRHYEINGSKERFKKMEKKLLQSHDVFSQ